jgi:hypothetical protein
MLDHEEVAALLHAMLTGFPDRAHNIVLMSEKLDEDERRALWDSMYGVEDVGDQLSALGDAMRVRGVDHDIVNEVYRASFYATSIWEPLTRDPLFSYFAANSGGHVLDKWVHYFPIYSKHLSPYVGRPVSVLEIGVYRGGSMQMWTSFFGPQARLVGMDIDPVAKAAAGDRYEVVLGDQSDPDFLRKVADEHGPFDVIIDDGGHRMEQQIVSVEALFPAVAEGGIYLVEDCHTSYWESYEGGRGRPGTFMEWTKERLDDLNGYHQPGDAVHPVWTREVDSIHIYDSVVILDREKRFAPFSEQKGGAAFVYAGRPLAALTSELVATRQAVLDERQALRDRISDLEITVRELEKRAEDGTYVTDLEAELAEAQDDLRSVRGELAAVRPRLARTQSRLDKTEGELEAEQSKLAESWDHVREMRSTVSWRLTSPLRRLRGRR